MLRGIILSCSYAVWGGHSAYTNHFHPFAESKIQSCAKFISGFTHKPTHDTSQKSGSKDDAVTCLQLTDRFRNQSERVCFTQ